MASLNHRPSSVAGFSATSRAGRTFMKGLSRVTTEQKSGIARRIDAQAYAAPFEQVAFAGDQVLDDADGLLGAGRSDQLVAQVQPELLRRAGQRDRAGDRIVAGGRLFDEAGDVVVIDLQEAQIGGLQQRGIAAADRVEPLDVVLDVSGLIPVARLDLVLFRVDVFFAAGDRLV